MASGGSSDTALLTKRGFAKTKRQLKNLASDINDIRVKGFAAISSAADRGMFRGMFATLPDLYHNFMSKWEELYDYNDVPIEPPFPTPEDENLLKEVKNCYYECHNYHQQITQVHPRPSTHNSTMLDTIANPHNTSRATLPTITIPPFGGDLVKWPTFKQLFTSLFKEDLSLTDAERFHYLVGHLRGQAYDSIKHIAVVSENFEQAWAVLLKTYDDPRKLASTYLNKFLNYRSQPGKPTAESLQTYISNVSESIASLRNLAIADLSEYLLCELALRSLDPYTREAFETSIIGTTFPRFTDLQTFVQNRCHVLRITSSDVPPITKATNAKPSPPFTTKSPNQFMPRPRQALMAQAAPPPKPKSCYLCQQNHTISLCPRFREATPQARLDLLRQFRGCRNCLSVHHPTLECTSTYSCRHCGKRHHTDLHIGPPATGETTSTTRTQRPSSPPRTLPGTSGFAGSSTTERAGVLLGTVTADLLTTIGQPHTFRGILDPGSQFSFVTEDCVRKLGLTTKSRRLHISGVNGAPLENVRGLAAITFRTDGGGSPLHTEAVVVPTITPPLPQSPLNASRWGIYLTYPLSDTTFMQPGPVSFLIGADLFPDVVTGSPIVLLDEGPRLLPTIFGLTVIGRYQDTEPQEAVALFTHRNLAPIMERFWAVEEPSFSPQPSPEEEICEKHFLETHHRAEDGRYVVSLPFKTSPPKIVPNLPRATNYFLSLESRLMKNPDLRAQYCAQMAEYVELGHMSPAKGPPAYIIPHHAVYKEVGDTKKLRVVFDASFRTATGSLNDHLLTGPKLQADISDILLNFRLHRYVFSCDVVKMFRQIWLSQDDRRYLQIIWRSAPTEPMQFFELNTVTFGLSCSPFLAQRVLRQHALNHQQMYPEAAHIVLNNTYIDDATAGNDSLSHLIAVKAQLIEMLRLGGFELGKWTSNHPALLEATSSGERMVRLCQDSEDTTKILGMHWNPAVDSFSYDVRSPPLGFTRRILLSSVARLYDPLGYIGPVVFQAKRLLQLTWTADLGWDDQLPDTIQSAWRQFVTELPVLSDISIARPLPPSPSQRELLVFGDASAAGYCAVAYLRGQKRGQTTMTLLKAKTKLAPLKTLTIPRLELCAAVLVSRLVKSLLPLQHNLNFGPIFCFTDSSTVLAWLNLPPYQLQVFVSNRIQQILSITQPAWWSHVRGSDNPADVGSRGISPAALKNHSLWWTGPEWCLHAIDQWPRPTAFPTEDLPEIKRSAQALLALAPPVSAQFLDCARRHSSFPRFVRSIAYVKRFLHNTRVPSDRAHLRASGPISSVEFEEANHHFIRRLQHHFYADIFLKPFNQLPVDLRRLNVFVDDTGLARVGGRLTNAPVTYDQKHQILLPRRSFYTNLIIHHYHLLNHHIGPAALLATIRGRYWIPGAKSEIRRIRHKCIICSRFSRSNVIPLMGPLPKSRFSNTRAFLVTGVDFAGPFLYRASHLRKASVQKAYLCLFLCMSTRAVHLEVAVGLSVEAFMDTFERFIMRRGKPAEMLSDGGTNFRGSDRYLREVIELFSSEDTKSQLIRYTAPQGIKWNFNPPSSPHFGGGWEVSIRMVKDLIFKTFGTTSFTILELMTAFTKVEGILNSRPLQALSSDPEDLEPLTPGHFLIGQPITALPEPDLQIIPQGRLNQWQQIRERVQHFWGRWKTEYLNSLQTRPKWDRQVPNIRVNDLVLLRDVDSSPTHWPLGRVIEVHPGQDGVVRVVTLRMARGVFKRPAVKLIPLHLKDIHG
ncbi:Retrotransposon protein [Nesidiocoris tenuis]|uniref:Retrotransposon protein n=1 Tax=Nesidiocoris tenuis TaxID=355587 RepID=A0ABN7AXV5_9HEMI|nr:Retrotransposon protein [Nesidiocoris tenuis]